MSDAKKVHRWLTQKELDAILDKAYRSGIRDARKIASELAINHAFGQECMCGHIIAMEISRIKKQRQPHGR